ncbi:hypothetical protein SUGI_0978200 [Cryptomeria japonica]|nr:hypothetical protein SUGI_0978200 [Cryptomeria japonica]
MLALTGLLLLLSSAIQGGEVGIGYQQSPIDIKTAYVQSNQTLGDLKKKYSPSKAAMINKGYEIQVVWSEYAGSLEIGGVKYRLNQSHWHHPAEHTINGKRFPLELHMVHISHDNKIAVIGILYKFGAPDFFLTKLKEAIDKIDNVKEVDLNVVDPNIIEIKRDATYYRYIGSLTTDPFTEGVTWTVMKKVRTITPKQADSLRKALHGKNNSREVQPLYGRFVQVYQGKDISKKETSLLWSS